jgi:hypothetical protein
MTLNIENGISALKQQIGRATYSMYGSRNFSDGTCDCSGAVYYGLTNGGVKQLGYIPSTETMHQWLLDNNYKLIAENSEWKMQAQDVIIWGRKGESAGAGGHTGIAVDGQNWIECTAWIGGGNGAEGGVIISNHDIRWAMNGCPYFYVYRSQQNSSTSDQTQTNFYLTAEDWGKLGGVSAPSDNNNIDIQTLMEDKKMLKLFRVAEGEESLRVMNTATGKSLALNEVAAQTMRDFMKDEPKLTSAQFKNLNDILRQIS